MSGLRRRISGLRLERISLPDISILTSKVCVVSIGNYQLAILERRIIQSFKFGEDQLTFLTEGNWMHIRAALQNQPNVIINFDGAGILQSHDLRWRVNKWYSTVFSKMSLKRKVILVWLTSPSSVLDGMKLKLWSAESMTLRARNWANLAMPLMLILAFSWSGSKYIQSAPNSIFPLIFGSNPSTVFIVPDGSSF